MAIGTISPSYKLDIQDTGSVAVNIQTNTSGNPSLFLTAGGSDGGAIFYDRASSQIRFSNSGASNAVVINSSGNVGIGTTSPVNNTGYGGLTLNGTSGAIMSFMENYAETFRLTNASGYSFINTTVATPLLLGTNSLERMRITSAGNIGIGTTNPIGKLTVKEVETSFEINTSSTKVDLLSFNRDTSSYKNLVFRAQDVIFSLSDVEKARFTNPGNLLINTTTDNGVDKLQVNGSGYFGGNLRTTQTLTIGSYSTLSESFIPGPDVSHLKIFNTHNTISIGDISDSFLSWIKITDTYTTVNGLLVIEENDGPGTLYVNNISNNYGSSLNLNADTIISGTATANSFIKSGGTSSQYLMADGSVTTGGGGGGSLPVKLTSQTLTQGSWSLVSGYYQYTFSNANIDTTSDVSVTPQNASYLTAYNAQVMPYVAVASGSCTFYAQFPPDADMTVDIVITQTA